MNTFNYVIEHATEILAILAATQLLLKAVVVLTPSPKDDAILAKVLPWLEKLGSFLSVKAKQAK